MGLLDELKQQAEELRVRQQATQEERSQHLLLAHAKLKDALHYWVELFNSLNVIKPAVPRSYHLDGNAARLDNLMQCDYCVNGRRVTQDHRDYISAITLRFRCVAGGHVTIEKPSDRLAQQLREHLWSNNLKFDIKEIRNERNYVERGVFTIPCEVPVTITIAAEPEQSHIRIVTANLEALGECTYRYDYDEFDNEILEELAKVILNKRNAFRAMGRYQQAMRLTTLRTAPPQPVDYAQPDPQQAEAGPAGVAAKGFVDSLKTILKR